MNQMEIFKNPEFGAIRAVEIDGEPWLVGKDVSLALGYTNPQKAIRDHVDAEDRTVNDSFTVNGTAITLINESGLYSLVLSSKLPKAKQFRRWVTSEVLPTIRKHGAYMTREKLWEVATSPEALLKLCSELLAEREENAVLREENALLEGKAAFFDLFIDMKQSTNLRTTAKELVVPERRFVRFLLEQRFVYRTASGNVLPYAKPSNDGLFCVKDYCNHGHIGSYTLVTPQGKLYFAQLRDSILLMIPTPGEYKAAHGQKYHDVSRSRGRWSGATVLRILEDERYIGSYVIGRRAVIEVGGTRSRRKERDKWFIIPDHHPAIVDKELFEKVQAVQRRFSLPTKKTREYPLKGKVYCGCCDHALSRIAQKKPFYMCRHSTADVNSRCRDVRADAAGLEEAVLLTLKKQLEILLPEHEDGTIHLEATAAKCSEYEKQLEALRDQKQSLFERYLLGQIELDTYKSEKAVYDAEILKVKNAYAAVTAQAKLKREEQARQSSRQEIVHSIAEADVLNSELTDLLIEKVYVFPDNRIEIVYKIHDLFE